MGNHIHSDGTRRPRAVGLASHITQCNGDIAAALIAMQGVERAGQPLEHLKLQEWHFRDAADFLKQSGHPEWADALTAHADAMYQDKKRGR